LGSIKTFHYLLTGEALKHFKVSPTQPGIFITEMMRLCTMGKTTRANSVT